MSRSMGFHDFCLFNQTRLARQAWRLLENPQSQCARLLKAKYYPNGHLLDKAFPKSSSPTWQGIIHGLELLKKELRVYDGRNINIWWDNWILRNSGLRILGKRSRSRVKWVSDLVRPCTKTWDEAVVYDVFYPHDS